MRHLAIILVIAAGGFIGATLDSHHIVTHPALFFFMGAVNGIIVGTISK